MASRAFGDGSQKPSFAKVAAMAASNTSKSTMNMQETRRNAAKVKPTNLPPPFVPSTAQDEMSIAGEQVPQELGHDIQVLNKKIERLKLDRPDSAVNPDGHVSVRPEASTEPDSALRAESNTEDDQTQLSNSSTKPTSFDSKSVASVTTFALDEKESLRPDDSASVKAAEEEESFSGPASAAPSSQVGSEAGARPFRDQFREISAQRTAAAISSGIPRFNDGSVQMPPGIPGHVVPNSMAGPISFPNVGNTFGFPSQPDEKLLEAMSSPKDRLFLLQLELKIMSFIKDSKDDILDLPPCNSFCRLLAHKLADYYHLTHFVDNNISAVRLYRTPVTRVPTSLSLLVDPQTTVATPPPNAPRRQIMRRAGVGAGGSTAVSSSVPSKAASETEGTSDEDPSRVVSPTDLSTKDKGALTREEREAKYKEARERIFGPNDESVPQEGALTGGDKSADMSRSSSSSGKKKSRKQRTPIDDSFQNRSQFDAIQSGMSFVNNGQAAYSGQFPEQYYANPYPLPSDPSMAINYVPNHPQSSQMFLPQPPLPNMQPYQMAMSQNVGQSEGWTNGPPVPWPYVNFGQAPLIQSQQSSSQSSPAMNNFAQPSTPPFQHPNRGWSQPSYPSPYQQQPVQPSMPIRWPDYSAQQQYIMGTPYQYGQLPSQGFNSGGSSPGNQHPIPGSYNRSTFNPQSRAFVPGGGSPLRYTGSKANASVPSASHFHSGQPPLGASPEPPVQPQLNDQGPPPSETKTDSIAKWGRPAHLPPKPPPPTEEPSTYGAPRQLPQSLGSMGPGAAKTGASLVPSAQQGLGRVHSPRTGVRMGI